MKRPFVLFWVAVLPQTVLLLLNVRNYQLVVGEMAPWQRAMCAKIGGFELLLLFGAIALIALLRIRRRTLSWTMCWPLLVLPILYLLLVTFQIGGELLPRSVTVWILPQENALYDQFAFMMPLIFYSMVRLSCAEVRASRLVEIVTALGIVIGIPLFFFVVMRLPWNRELFRIIPALVNISFFVIGTVAVIAAATRLLVIGYIAVRKKGPLALGIFAGVVGIVAPISGLLLNRWLPFPADFQAVSVYAMTVTNGLILLLPNFRHPFLHRAIWLAQCALFPFTVYFFLVFLPFLPFSIPAIIYFGAGFLVLTPTALFLVHGQRILDGYRNEWRDGGRLIPALLAVLAISIIPATYTIEAVLDRIVLRHAIDYVYNPDYRADTHFSGNPALVRRSLQHLRDFKAGLNLPYLSGFYNWVVFDGLVLPDEKMNYLHGVFFGRELERPKSSTSGFFAARPASRAIRETTTPSTPHDVRLLSLTTTVNSEGSCDRATISFQMKNDSLSQSEFVTQIHLPEGVLVSGFWLHIGKERVPGQLFEKKTALWVYQMIRDRTRRDPGLLLYKNPQTLELRVFPFATGEERKVEVELLYPASSKPSIDVGDKTLHPSGDSDADRIMVVQTGDDSSAALFSPAALLDLPHLTRTPYLHFIIDRSVGSQITAQSAAAAIRATRTQFPNVRECMVTVANYESADLTSEPTVITTSSFQPQIDVLTARGAFLPQRAIKRALLRYNDDLCHSQVGSPWLSKFPLFIIIRGEQSEPLQEPDLESFGKFTPDIAGYYSTVHGTRLEPRTFAGEGSARPYTLRPICLLKAGNAIAPLPFDLDTPTVVNFTSKPSSGLAVFDPALDIFTPLAQTEIVSPTERYARGIAAWQDYLALIYNPSRGHVGLSEVVRRSRASGVMVGSTSFIVVENSAQWKMLERKQNQKLRNNTALEIEAVPEPSTWCLIFVGAAFLLFCLRKSASRT